MNDYDYLSRAELIEKIKELKQIISVKNKQQEEYEKCTARVYAPNKSYKELEEKLQKLEQEKNQEIDRLVDTMAKANKEIQRCQQDYYNLKSRNIDLEGVIEKQNVIITLAAGYISSTSQFSNTHPIDVKKWLMGGME
jgi:hypothetical protein